MGPQCKNTKTQASPALTHRGNLGVGLAVFLVLCVAWIVYYDQKTRAAAQMIKIFEHLQAALGPKRDIFHEMDHGMDHEMDDECNHDCNHDCDRTNRGKFVVAFVVAFVVKYPS